MVIGYLCFLLLLAFVSDQVHLQSSKLIDHQAYQQSCFAHHLNVLVDLLICSTYTHLANRSMKKKFPEQMIWDNFKSSMNFGSSQSLANNFTRYSTEAKMD